MVYFIHNKGKQMAKRKKSIIKNIIFYLIVTLMLFFIIVSRFFPEESINYTGFKFFTIVSGSMEPDIMINDVVVDVKVKQENLQVGDAITFYTYLLAYNGSYIKSEVTHYLAAIVTEGNDVIYKTQGAGIDDDTYDSWVDENGNPTDIRYDDIIGRVKFVIPNIGGAIIVMQNIVRNPIMVILIIVNIGIIIIVVKVTKKALREGKKA